MAGTDRRGEGGPVLLLLHGSALGVPRRGFWTSGPLMCAHGRFLGGTARPGRL